MAQCTAPIRGHRTAAAAAACPVCGRYGSRRSYYPSYDYSSYSSSGYSYSSSGSSSSRPSSGGSKRKAKWSPTGSAILYTEAQIRSLTPIHETIVKQQKNPDKYDLFLCHAWDDRKGIAKELYEKLTDKGVNAWFSEKDLKLGTNMLREIDKGLAKSRAGIVLVTPNFFERIKGEGVADKELSALLAKDQLLPVVHNTTYDALRDVSPLLGSRSGLDTNEDSMEEIVDKIADLFAEDEE